MTALFHTPLQFALGAAADLAFGDPRWLPHPVSGIARVARWNERAWRASGLPLRFAGVLAWLGVVGPTAAFVWATLVWLPEPFVQGYWIFSFLALRGLDQHAMAVVEPLSRGDLQEARIRVGYMVGRDTAAMSESEVARALIETVAENASDGVIAPLFWLMLGGPAAMAAYKAVNTLDSMVGYRNERYRDFGWWSARADDWANWIPARLTAALFWIVAAIMPGMHARESVRVTVRDAHRQPSPNSGYPEAAAAGAIGVRLGGVSFYKGVRSEKAFLGDAIRPLDVSAYGPMRMLLYGASATMYAAVWSVAR